MSSEASYDANNWTEEDETAWAWQQACAVSLFLPISSAERSDVLVLLWELSIGRVKQPTLFGIDRRWNMKVQSMKRMGAGGVAGRVDSMTINTVVRKLGHTLRVAMQVMEENLRHSREETAAERLHLTLGPLVEALTYFDVNARDDVSRETEEE